MHLNRDEFQVESLEFVFESCDTLYCLSDSGREFQTESPETEKDLFPVVSREKRGTVSKESLASETDSVLEKGQKDMIAHCFDRYKENRDR